MITVERCIDGRLRAAYPVAWHDVELRVDGADAQRLGDVLAVEAERILANDPACRKVVFAAPVGDEHVLRDCLDAGFRHVVDVDLPHEQVSLLVREPGWVTAVDMDLDRVPQT